MKGRQPYQLSTEALPPCERHVEPDARRLACPVREKLNGLKISKLIQSRSSISWLISRSNRGDQDRPYRAIEGLRQMKRVGEGRPSRIPLMGLGPNPYGYRGVESTTQWGHDFCPSSGLVQRERTGELSCGDARHRARGWPKGIPDDNARRPGGKARR